MIPNPPGCSYGLDLDYFCYSSESEDEQEPPLPRTEPNKFGRLTRTAVRGALRSERHSSKKVRFDASPEDTPSKLRLRARATDPYRGRHFIGMGNDSEIATPDSPTPAPHAADESSSRRPGFVPNVQGTFQLDYDAFSDDSDSSGASASANVSASAPIPAPSSATVTQASISERYYTFVPCSPKQRSANQHFSSVCHLQSPARPHVKRLLPRQLLRKLTKRPSPELAHRLRNTSPKLLVGFVLQADTRVL